MTEAYIDQIEFRWDSRDDLTGIAWSFEGQDRGRWNELLRPYAGVSGRGGPAAAEAPSSAVYLTYPDGTAALILRGRDPHARRLYEPDAWHTHGAGADRLDLVARALIAPKTLLTAQYAMRIAVTEPKVLFDPPPGQADRRGVLPRPAWSAMQEAVVSTGGVERMAKNAKGLAPVIAAVLADPARPVTVVLPPEDIRRPVHDSRSLALLWASRALLQPLLGGVDDGPAPFGWRPAFSTCEAPLSSSDGRDELWLTFRERGLDGPPVGEAPAVVHLDRAAAGQSVFDAAANRLAEAYQADGDQCVSLVEHAVRGHRTLAARIEAVACSEEIARVLSAQPPVKVQRPPAPRPVHAPVPAVDPVPAAPAHQPPPAVQEPEPPVRRPQRADLYLVVLYRRLDAAHDERDVRRLLGWIAARTARGARLDRNGLGTVLKIMDGRRWFAEPVGALDAAAERMADLIHPIFASGVDDGRLEERLEKWHTSDPPSPLVVDALSVLAARLEPDRADWLADHCLRHPPPWTRPAGSALLLTLLRLPRRWPAEIAGPLAWLSPVLLLVVGYLLLT